MKPSWKSASAKYSRQQDGVKIARPLKTAPANELLTARVAASGNVPSTSAQVETVPSSVANRICAGVPRTTKSSAIGLNTIPVGAEAMSNDGLGTTILDGDWSAPVASNASDEPVLLSAIQNVWPGMKASPQGLISPGSVRLAAPLASETRFVWW